MSLLKNSLVYLISNVANASIPFILMPILTRNLTVHDYGQLAVFQAFVVGLSAIVGINTTGIAIRKQYDRDISKKALVDFNSHCLYILMFSLLVPAVIILNFDDIISSEFGLPKHWLLYSLAASFGIFVVNLRLAIFQAKNQPEKYLLIQVGSSFVNVALSLYFIFNTILGAEGRVLGQVLASLLFSFVSFISLINRKEIGFVKLNKIVLKEALLFGVPLIPHVIGLFVLSSMDKMFVNNLLGAHEVGVYMVAIQLSLILVIFCDSVNKAFTPWLYAKLRDSNKEESAKMHYLILCIIPILFISSAPMFLWGGLIVELIAGTKYSDSGELLGLLWLGQSFGVIYMVYSGFLFYFRKTKIVTIITLTSGCVNISALIILIPDYGLIGACYAFLLGKVTHASLTYFMSKYFLTRTI